MDYSKLLLLLTPIKLRTGIHTLLSAIAWPMQDMYDQYTSWCSQTRMQAAITCQVMYLELLLNSKIENNSSSRIYITDANGIEADFEVNMPAGIELDYRLQAYLDTYKIAGKRYRVKQSSIAYAYDWVNMHCEIVQVTYAAQWINTHCEVVEGVPDNYVTIWTDPIHYPGQFQLRTTYPVKTTLQVTVQYQFSDQNPTNNYTERIDIFSDQAASVLLNYPYTAQGVILSIDMLSVLPTADDYYNYHTT
jgi:hypothetical protein